MSQKVNLTKQGFLSSAYKNAIDTSFTQLVQPPPPVEETVSVEQFFNLYQTLFYEIPAEGSINSHTYLIKQSTEYIGFTEEKEEDIQVLLDEITLLREELLDTQKQLRDAETSASIQAQTLAQSSELTSGTQITSDVTNVGRSRVIG
jgi:hypothetical protein